MLLDKPDSTDTLGLDYCDGKILAVSLKYTKEGPCFQGVSKAQVEEDLSNVKRIDIRDNLQSLVSDANKILSVTALEVGTHRVRSMKLQVKKLSDVQEVLPFQVEPFLPFPIEQAVIDWIEVSQSEKEVELTWLSVRYDLLRDHLEKWQGFGVEPEVVMCIPLALSAFARYACPEKEETIFLKTVIPSRKATRKYLKG